MEFSEYVAIGILVGLLFANAMASRLVIRDDYSGRLQKTSQLLMVWLIPVIGAIVVFAIHRADEKHSGKYSNPPYPGEEYRDPARSAANARAGIDATD